MKALGPYKLEETVGAGGMCDVWRATGPDDETVAVKVLRSEFSSELLHDEIHLMTSLYHPGIVTIHGWGDATEVEAESLDVRAGTPWVAMDYADGGSLAMDHITNFAEFRHLALSLLDALMHSHARGVIHRDIKPGNILVGGDPHRYMLSDFGIAFPKSRVREGTYEVPMAAAGTMNYIAPEQLIGRWRDFNSYTDLFSLGVVLFELATGELPFPGKTRIEVALAHQKGMRWPGRTRFVVPPCFEEWISNLLAHDPAQRYAFAADTAHELLALGDPEGVDETVAPAAFDDALTIPDGWGTTLFAPPQPTTGGSIQATIHLSGPRPPVPSDWRPRWWGNEADHGIRSGVEMLGREAERDELWRRLHEVTDSGRSRSVVIRGNDGLGASRLAMWLCHRAHEVGAADDIFVWRRHGASALADTMRHVLRLGGLDARDRQERLRELLGEVDVDLELVAQLALGLPLSVPDQTYVVETIMSHFSARRPLIIWVDDAHSDLELLEVATRVTGTSHAVLFLLTARDEALPELPYERRQLEALLASESATELRLGPMEEAELVELVESRVDLRGAVLDEIIRASHGNPLHALQNARLVASGGAFDFGGLDAVWRSRVERALTADEQAALTAAAVLGDGVHMQLWSRLCDRMKIPFTPMLADRFIKAGFWNATSFGYTFAHSTLRRALLSADGVGEIHREAASLYNARFAGVAPMRAQHLVASGEYLLAATVTYRAVIAFHSEARLAHARSVTEWFALALDRERVPVGHPARSWAALMRECQSHEEGAFTPVLAAVETLAETAYAGSFRAEALRIQSYLETAAGEHEQALATAQRALQLADHVEPSFLSGLYNRAGRALLRLGRADEAVGVFEAGGTIDDAPISHVATRVGWGYALLELDRVDEARQILGSTVELARANRIRLHLAHALNALADAERRQGDLTAAKRHYTEAIRLVCRADPAAASTAELNLALCLVKLGQPRDGVAIAERVIGETSHPFLRSFAHLVGAASAAHIGDVAQWERLVEEIVPFPSIELAEIWVDAAERWIAGGDLPRAMLAFERARGSVEGVEHERGGVIRAEIDRRIQALSG